MLNEEYVDSLIECNRELAKINTKLINQSNAMMNGISEVVNLISNKCHSMNAEYEETFAQIMKTLDLAITRGNNYTRDYDHLNR